MQYESTTIHEENGKDLFRYKERSIRRYFKRINEEIECKNKKKKLWKNPKEEEDDNEPINFDWAEVVDIRNPNHSCDKLTLLFESPQCLSYRPHKCTCNGSKVFLFNDSPGGFYFIQDALCPAEQLYWAKIAIENYSNAEHTNLSNLSKINKQSSDEKKGKELESFEEINLWEQSQKENNNFLNFKKLRWSCLGYHYDWTSRSYQRDMKSIFPEDFATLCKTVAHLVNTDFIPEAAIINFYPLGTSMGGHLDDAEHNLNTPIVSFSIGSSSLFLMGGKSKLIEPKSVLLRSGDAVVMSGESRLCYHGVPFILSQSIEDHLCSVENYDWRENLFKENDGSEATTQVIKYLMESRVNMNSRQVKKDDEVEWLDKNGTPCIKYPM